MRQRWEVLKKEGVKVEVIVQKTEKVEVKKEEGQEERTNFKQLESYAARYSESYLWKTNLHNKEIWTM